MIDKKFKPIKQGQRLLNEKTRDVDFLTSLAEVIR